MRLKLDRQETAELLRELIGPAAPGKRALDLYASRKLAAERGEEVSGEVGPRYTIFGVRAVYDRDEVIAWANAKLSPKRKSKQRRPKRRLRRPSAEPQSTAP